MKLVFMVEEISMKVCLETLLPKIFSGHTDEVSCLVLAFHGKGDLENQIPIKLRGWGEPDTKFVILRDQDNEDCRKVKSGLVSLSNGFDREVLVRVVCHELEAWYFGDLQAVSKAYGKDLTGCANKKQFREPDAMISPKKRLQSLLPEHQQIAGARAIAPHMDVERNTSESFQQFVSGVRRLAGVD